MYACWSNIDMHSRSAVVRALRRYLTRTVLSASILTV